MENNEQEAIDAVNVLAELAYIFFQHCLEIGSNVEEASSLTQAFIHAMMKKD